MKYSSLVEVIIKTKRKSGKPLISITDYWGSKIKPLDYKYRYFIPDVYGNKGVCPLHDDQNPSFGVVIGRDGIERFNCFGCQQFGHIVDLHRKILQRYQQQNLTPHEAAISLLHYYDLPVSDFLDQIRDTKDTLTNIEGNISRRKELSSKLHANTKVFTQADYEESLIEGLKSGQGTAYYNNLLYKATLGLT